MSRGDPNSRIESVVANISMGFEPAAGDHDMRMNRMSGENIGAMAGDGNLLIVKN